MQDLITAGKEQCLIVRNDTRMRRREAVRRADLDIFQLSSQDERQKTRVDCEMGEDRETKAKKR